MMKPSDQIKNIVPGIAFQRLELAKANRRALGDFTLMTQAQEDSVLEQLRTEPTTWIMAVIAFMDSQHELAMAMINNMEEGSGKPN